VRRYVKFRVKWRTLWMVSAGERRDEVSGGRLPLGFSGGWPNKQPLTANPLTNLALHCPVGQISHAVRKIYGELWNTSCGTP
jgi:hypothetical protein